MSIPPQPFISLVDQILTAKKQHTPSSPLNRGEFKDADTSALGGHAQRVRSTPMTRFLM